MHMNALAMRILIILSVTYLEIEERENTFVVDPRNQQISLLKSPQQAQKMTP